MRLNVNTDAVVAYTNKLEKLRKSALPNAVRETLSKAALDVKQRTMPATAKKQFVNRSKNFFKAFSRVEFAKGKNMAAMRSVVGFTESGLRGGRNESVKDLDKQEHGGKIGGKSFIPMDEARVGKSPSRMVRIANRISGIDSIVKAYGSRGKGKRKVAAKKQRWIRAAFMAKKMHGNAAFVLGNPKAGRMTLRRIDSISSNALTRKLEIKSTPVYSFKKGRSVSVKSTGFMKRASMDTATNMDLIFISEARKEIQRVLNK